VRRERRQKLRPPPCGIGRAEFLANQVERLQLALDAAKADASPDALLERVVGRESEGLTVEMTSAPSQTRRCAWWRIW
jgi:hypothetical protein